MRWYQKLLIHVVTSLGLAIGWVSIERHLVWNITPSMPTGLYWYWPSTDVQEGDIVFFAPPDIWLDAMARIQGPGLRHTPIMKRIHALTPTTMVVFGEHRHSLDSRTLGPVPRTRLIGRGWALWTSPIPRMDRTTSPGLTRTNSATVTGVSLPTPGTGYVMQATASGLITGLSAPFSMPNVTRRSASMARRMARRNNDADLAALLAQGHVRILDGQLTLGDSRAARDPLSASDELERSFMRRVRATAYAAGWLIYHTVDAKRSDPGFPDLILLRPGEGIAAECKRNNRQKPRANQVAWLALFASLPGMEACVWRPRDEAAILARLTTPARPQEMPTMQSGVSSGHYDRWVAMNRTTGEGFSGVNLAPTVEEETRACRCIGCRRYRSDATRTCHCTGRPLCPACAQYAKDFPPRSTHDTHPDPD